MVAETFLVAWRRFEKLPQDALPWLIVTARNIIANRHRAAARDRALASKLVASAEWRFQPSAIDELDEIDQQLLEAIKQLPNTEREAFLLVAWDGLNPARAAAAAGCSPATFRMRLHRARKRLRREMGGARPLAPLPDVKIPLKENR